MTRVPLAALALALLPALAGAQATPPRQPAPTPATPPRPAAPAPRQATPPESQPAVTGVIAPDVLASQVWQPGMAPGLTITLAQAVEQTLRSQPRIALAAQDTMAARAQLQQATGVFDPVFTFAPGGDYTQQPVAPGFLGQQRNNRTLMKQLHLGFTRANLQLRDILTELESSEPGRALPLPRCPLDFSFSFATDAVTLDGLDRSEIAALGVSQDQFPFAIADLERSLGVDLRSFCNGPLNQDPLDAILFELSYGRLVSVDQGRPFGLEGILKSGVEAPKESIRLLQEISEAVAARARLALERLGPLPKDQFTRHFSLRTALSKPMRNGLNASVELLLESEENNFRDKTLDPTFGGAGFPPRFPSSLTFGLLVPLGKGRGSVAVAAQERAAALTVEARGEQARHVASEEIYRTLLAYIRVIAAQENLRLAQQSTERQKSMLSLTDQRVRGGEAAGVDLSRAQARAASVSSSVSGAQAELVDARMSLAEAMGVEAGSLTEAPGAADRFADVRVDEPAVAALIAAALESRRDRLALDEARRASAELAAGARADTRRTFDVNLSAGIAQAYESENFRYLYDERNPIFTELADSIEFFGETHRYYSPKGFWRGLTGRWEPFVTASISFDLPIGNNAAKGRLAQAQATLRSSEVQFADRTRLIGDTIVGVVQSLRAAADNVLRARQAVERTQATFEGIRAQLQAGEATLIDTLSTEEELLADQTQLVRAQQVYLSTLARLRFEAGQLVSFTGLGDASESARFIPTDFVMR